MTCQCSGIVFFIASYLYFRSTRWTDSNSDHNRNCPVMVFAIFKFKIWAHRSISISVQISVAVFIYTCSVNDNNVLPCANIFSYKFSSNVFLPSSAWHWSNDRRLQGVAFLFFVSKKIPYKSEYKSEMFNHCKQALDRVYSYQSNVEAFPRPICRNPGKLRFPCQQHGNHSGRKFLFWHQNIDHACSVLSPG